MIDPRRPRPLLLAEGVGIGPILSLVEQMRNCSEVICKPLVLIGSDTPFPFRPRPSRITIAGIPDGSIACMPLLDEWGVASRLASRADLPGCFDGSVTQLAEHWLGQLSPEGLLEVEVFMCGPSSMLEATTKLARHFGIPCQVVPERGAP
jgi:dihydroorotate dehydrogenase electron transfer subunit